MSIKNIFETSNKININLNASSNGYTSNHYCLCGPPGSVKSLLLKILCLYATCLGLNCTITSVPTDQSNISGGTHLHLLYKLSANNKTSYHPLQEANEAIHNLNKNDAALAYLFSLDIIIIEEIGLLNSELYSTLEIISQYIMDNNNRSGGKLILCNGDPFQLTNISGSSF